MRGLGNIFGAHRVISPEACLPQRANKLDISLPIYDNEILIDVEILLITSAVFSRIKKECQGKNADIAKEIQDIVNTRGKFQDPITGAGGMLIGVVNEIGSALVKRDKLQIGRRIATLVSLALTPLRIDKIKRINQVTHQVFVEGQAVLFEKSIYSEMPGDLPAGLVVSLMDVAGAPAKIAVSAVMGDTVVVFGAGKAGLLCLHEAVKRVGPNGKVISVELDQAKCKLVEELNLADVVIRADATRPLEVYNSICKVTNNEMADLAVNCTNVADTEMSCVLSTKERGRVYFFNMATSFSAAALGTEGVGLSTELLIGNGYTPGHSQLVLEIIRENKALQEVFLDYYS